MPNRKAPSIKFNWKWVTPTLAKKMLSSSVNNRTLNERTVDKYARDMTDGNWQNNGDVIRITAGGKILDGQHRLSAVVKSKKPVYLAICKGVSENAMPTVDCGRKRSLSDILKLQGHSYTSKLSASIINCMQLDQGKSLSSGGSVYSHSEALDALNDNYKDLPKFMEDNYAKIRQIDGPSPSLLTAIYYHMKKNAADKALVDKMFEQLSTGANIPKLDPILALSRYLRRSREERNIDRNMVCNAFYHAYLMKRKNQKLKAFAIRSNSTRLSIKNK